MAQRGLGLVLVLLLAVLAGALITGALPRAVEAVRLVRDLVALGEGAGAGGESAARVERQTVAYDIAGVRRQADLYRPPEAKAALVLVAGAAPQGRHDPRLVAFALLLAERGFLVLVPALAAADPVRVSAADAAAVADAVVHLTGRARVASVGLAAISYAAGPAILAALEPALEDKIDFILALGGYHDITAAITYLTTGAYRAGGAWRAGPVEPRAKWRFLLANADRIAAADADRLARIARAKLADPEADVSQPVARLGPAGRAAWRLIANTEPERVPHLLAALPVSLRQELRALDLARRDLSALDAALILVHGRDDPMVPYTQSLELAEAAGEGRAETYILDALYHVDLAAPALEDALRLLAAAYRLLAARDRAPAPQLPGAVRDFRPTGVAHQTGPRPPAW